MAGGPGVRISDVWLSGMALNVGCSPGMALPGVLLPSVLHPAVPVTGKGDPLVLLNGVGLPVSSLPEVGRPSVSLPFVGPPGMPLSVVPCGVGFIIGRIAVGCAVVGFGFRGASKLMAVAKKGNKGTVSDHSSYPS